MVKTKIKKAIALTWVASIAMLNLSPALATNIGTAQITGGASENIIYDNVTKEATASVTGVEVIATIIPTLNMTISAAQIDLGNLVPGTPSTGSVGIEVGTNAANGVTITARSGNGWLENLDDGTIVLNDNNDNSYTFASSFNAIDSTVSGFASTGNLTAIEVVNNTTEHLIYQTNKPERFDNTNADVTFTVAANINAEAAAGDYRDEITFTVTGNF